MQSYTYLAFDYGLKRLGVAVGQTITGTAQALTTLRVRNGQIDWSAISELDQRWQPCAFVIGLPVNKDGSENDLCRAVRQFAEQLRQHTQRPVHFADERYSSLAANNLLAEQRQTGLTKRRVDKQQIDQTAAAVILQAWLTDNRNSAPE